MSVHIKQGSTDDWKTVLTSSGISDLSTASAIALFMRKQGATANKINGATAAISSATASQIDATYDTQAADVDTPGTYRIYWRVTFSGGDVVRFPSEGYDELVIEPHYE